MSDPFIGELRPFAFSYNPSGWLPCNGQQVSLQQYQALFAVIGTLYGPSDYRTYFTLPNLNKLTPMHATGDAVPGWMFGSVPTVGSTGGEAGVFTGWNSLPQHTHIPSFGQAPASVVTGTTPTNTSVPFRPYYPATKAGYFAWSSDTPSGNQPFMNPETIGPAGASGNVAAHENQQPYMPLYMCIASMGLFPVREN